MISLADVDFVVLAGGYGTRLQEVNGPDLPKFLTPFGNEPFAMTFLKRLHEAGARRVILALAHGASQIIDWLSQNGRYTGLDIILVVEDQPRGTASALKACRQHIGSEPFIVMNGDTLLNVDLTMVLSRWWGSHVRTVFGMGPDGQPVCAGVHLIARGLVPALFPDPPPNALDTNPEAAMPADLEERISKVTANRAAYLTSARFWDIGTPEGLHQAKRDILHIDDE
jgi:NDP-sugar pyrophosphorylase family protein